VTLVHRLGLSRDSLARTLGAAIEAGWVVRNPGHGHPMRPEYVPTPAGRALAPAARRVLRRLRALGADDVGRNKWSLPVVYALCGGEDRFSALKGGLHGITPRALTEALKALEKAGLLEREVVESYPPTVRYRLTAAGRSLCAPLRALADALDA